MRINRSYSGRDDAHQYPYSYQEIVNRFNRGTLWNKSEYELVDADAVDRLIKYFTGKYSDYTQDSEQVTFDDGDNSITIVDRYLYTEALHDERYKKTTDYEKLLNRGIRELDSAIANLDSAWEYCPGEIGEDLDQICRELRQLHNNLETLKDNRSYAEDFAKKERRKRFLKEASYGGAYDIEDDQFFTREELNEFGERLADSISEKIDGEPIRYNGAYVDDNVLSVSMENELGEIEKEVKLDFRTIRKPSDIDKYSKILIPQFIEDFVDLGANEL